MSIINIPCVMTATLFIEHYLHFLPLNVALRTFGPNGGNMYRFWSKRHSLPCVQSLLVFRRMLNSFIALLIAASRRSTARPAARSQRPPLCHPWTETPFLSLTHTAHHSFLIRGGGGGEGRVEQTSRWPAPSKQEGLLGPDNLGLPHPAANNR